jgi:hypothetical protein
MQKSKLNRDEAESVGSNERKVIGENLRLKSIGGAKSKFNKPKSSKKQINKT